MVLEELVEAGKLATGYVVVATEMPDLLAVKAIFLLHEGIGVPLELLTHSRMVCQELLQSPMVFDEVLVVDERRILLQLFRDFRMAVHKAIHAGQLSTS